MSYVVREDIGKKSDEIAKLIPLDCEQVQIVLYGKGVDNIFDIVENKPTVFVRKDKKASAVLQRVIDSCCTFDIIAFYHDDEILVVKNGNKPWYNDRPSSLGAI